MRHEKYQRFEGKCRSIDCAVEKIITPILTAEPEKAQIGIEDADHLYREIRIPNVVTDDKGKKAALKPGAEDVVVEADANALAATPRPEAQNNRGRQWAEKLQAALMSRHFPGERLDGSSHRRVG